MTVWRPLDAELAEWAAARLSLPMWWRDDDAVTDTPALRRLAALGDATGLPIHLAVIPARADSALAALVARNPQLIPMVHGWSHANHAAAGEKKAEFGAQRPLAARLDDASRGLARLDALFGPRLMPAFVPPWNRIAPDLVAALPGAGFRILSCFSPRAQARTAEGLVQINTHIDPIDWHGTRGLIDQAALIDRIATVLRTRRLGQADRREPLGLLTHHIVHDAALWSFCAQLVDRLMAGPGFAWRAKKEGFPNEPS